MNYPLSDPYTQVAARVAGTMSGVASYLIIFIVMRSTTKLSTIYHRIMFGMSSADIFASMSVALTTIPMPKELPEEMMIPGIEWVGVRLGNAHTCGAQGFFIVSGKIIMLMYNASLWIYYLCALGFKMDEKKIIKFVEPFLHLIPITFTLALSVPSALKNRFGVTKLRSYCNVSKLDSWDNDDGSWSMYHIYFFIIIAILVILYFISLLFILSKVYRTDKILSSCSNPAPEQSRILLRRAKESYHNTKVIIIQASAYIISYLITIAIIAITTVDIHNVMIMRIQAFILPQQGLFNLLIFVGHKIYNHRRVNPNASRCEVIYWLLTEPIEEPVLFTRISQIHYSECESRLEVQLNDENGCKRFSVDDSVGYNIGIVSFSEEYQNDLNSLGNIFPIAEENPSELNLPHFGIGVLGNGNVERRNID